jgi:hypothetical protein
LKPKAAAVDRAAAADVFARARRVFVESERVAAPTAGMDPGTTLLAPIIRRARENYSRALADYKLACLVARQAGLSLTPLEDALADTVRDCDRS